MATSIVSVDDLIGYMSGIVLQPYQRESAQDVLDGVQSELEKYINRPIGVRHVREFGMTDVYGVYNVKVSPVHRVISISTPQYSPTIMSTLTSREIKVEADMRDIFSDEDGIDPVEKIDYVHTPEVNGLRAVGSPGIIPGGIVIGQSDTDVVVEYLAGYIGDLVPAMKLAILRVAAREMERMHDDTRSLIGQTNQEGVDSAPTPKGWQDDELRQFDRARRRVIRSG